MNETRCPLPITHKVEKIDETANGPRAYVRSTVHLMAVMAIDLDCHKGEDLAEAYQEAQQINTRRILDRVYRNEADRAAEETLKVVSSIRPWADPEACKKLMELPQHYRYMPPRANQDDSGIGQLDDGAKPGDIAVFRTRDGLECMTSIRHLKCERYPHFPRTIVRLCRVRVPVKITEVPEMELRRRFYEWTGRFVDRCPVFQELD
jgi:hypothetical protein